MEILKEEKADPGNKSAPTPRILVAEDNMVNQKLITLLFQKLNLKVEIVSNGLEAVEAILDNHYDLILMDIQMPEMDGIEATGIIKEKLGDKCPTVVALTANAMNGDRERFLDAGMDHYLSKPIDIRDLKRVVEEYTFYDPC